MTDLTTRLEMPYLMPSQAQKHVTHNEALRRLDQLVQLVLQDSAAEVPPGTPGEGMVYGLGAAPQGAWAGQGGQLAAFDDGAWHFFTPRPGWLAWDLSTGPQGQLRAWDGSAWQDAAPEQLAQLGIGTAADAQNPLAAAGAATLLTHAGAGHQLKINKAGPAETASLLFQSGWQGHAEIGLTGSNALAIKVSADGSSWSEALRVDPATATLTGAAVQASAEDTTAGRLMRADYGYSPGNLLGPVALAGSTPSGAVLERGEGADGAWIRLADGTQMIWAARSAGTAWSFPQSFAAAPVVTVTAAAALARMVAVSGVTASGATPQSYDSSGSAQPGETLHCLAVGRWG